MYSRIVDEKGRIRLGQELYSLHADVGVYSQSGIETGKYGLMFMKVNAHTSFGDSPALAVMTPPFWETLISGHARRTVPETRRTLYPDRKTRRALRFSASSRDSPLRTQNRVHISAMMMKYAEIPCNSCVFIAARNGYAVISTDHALIAELEAASGAPATNIDELIAEIVREKQLEREAAATSA